MTRIERLSKRVEETQFSIIGEVLFAPQLWQKIKWLKPEDFVNEYCKRVWEELQKHDGDYRMVYRKIGVVDYNRLSSLAVANDLGRMGLLLIEMNIEMAFDILFDKVSLMSANMEQVQFMAQVQRDFIAISESKDRDIIKQMQVTINYMMDPDETELNKEQRTVVRGIAQRINKRIEQIGKDYPDGLTR